MAVPSNVGSRGQGSRVNLNSLWSAAYTSGGVAQCSEAEEKRGLNDLVLNRDHLSRSFERPAEEREVFEDRLLVAGVSKRSSRVKGCDNFDCTKICVSEEFSPTIVSDSALSANCSKSRI